jgi:hypothetical protein
MWHPFLKKSCSNDIVHQMKSSLIFFCRYIFLLLLRFAWDQYSQCMFHTCPRVLSKDKQRSTKHYIETQFLLHMWHPCYKPGNKSRMRKRPDWDYDNTRGHVWNIHCEYWSHANNWVVYPSSSYGFWFPIWNLQTFSSTMFSIFRGENRLT